MLKKLCFISNGLSVAVTLGATKMAFAACAGTEVSTALVSSGCLGDGGTNPIYALVNLIITMITGVLGLLMVLMIVIAGLQYALAGGSPDRVRSAKERLEHVGTGFLLFVIMWGVLQVILPPDVSIF